MTNSGWLYLVQPQEFIGTTIYKIGRTKNISRRMTQYGQDRIEYRKVYVDDMYRYESMLIDVFYDAFDLYQGNEYFECINLDRALSVFDEFSRVNIMTSQK